MNQWGSHAGVRSVMVAVLGLPHAPVSLVNSLFIKLVSVELLSSLPLVQWSVIKLANKLGMVAHA